MLTTVVTALTLAFSPSTLRPASVLQPVLQPILQQSFKVTRTSSPIASILALEAIEPAFSSYAAIWTPLLASFGAPDFLLHWGHGAAMSTVLFSMGGYGTYLGWQTRLGNGEDVLPLNLGKPSREMHSLLMQGALFFFLLGGQGGFVLLALQGQPILASNHSSTAVIGLALLFAQAVLGKTMGDSEVGRTIHAFLGSFTMLALVAHAAYGLQLGLSF